MLVENLLYLATFIATTGIAAIGTLVAFQLLQQNKQPVFQILLYQQIFLFSAFIYSIWGNIALRQVIADVNLPVELAAKLAFFIPMPGIPFLVVCWFMLLKFAFNLNGYREHKGTVYTYFTAFLLLLVIFTFLFQNNYLNTPLRPDLQLVRIFVVVNLAFHLVFILPFLKPAPGKPRFFNQHELVKCVGIYFLSMLLYSGFLWFLTIYGSIFVNISFILVFISGALLPVCLKFLAKSPEKPPKAAGKDFKSFCADYEISKREAEIVLEICSGKTNKAIAEKLFITLQTVKDHTHRIYTKTRVKSRVQLANLVRERVTFTQKTNLP
jgi:DNA-binding CsgD family transcriptional regulator